MKMIMRFLKDYKKECVLAPLFKMLEAIFELFVPLVVSSVIDKGIVNADKGYIMQMCFMLILLAIIGLVCAITAQYFSAKAAVGAATGMRHSLSSLRKGHRPPSFSVNVHSPSWDGTITLFRCFPKAPLTVL